jgi:hypothetical protein
MKSDGISKLFGLSIACVFLTLPNTASSTLAKGAEHPTPLKYFCESIKDDSCIESLEYFNKDRPDLGFVDLGIPVPGMNGSAVFKTDGTTFTTTNGVAATPVTAWASIYNLTSEENSTYVVPGYSNSASEGILGGPAYISVLGTDGVRFGVHLGGSSGYDYAPLAGTNQLRIGDKFRMRLRINTINLPTAFETSMSNFGLSAEKSGGFNVLVADGEVTEQFTIRSGSYVDTCGGTSSASGSRNKWETYAYSSTPIPGSDGVPASYKIRGMGGCQTILPYFSSDGVIKFGMAMPHFRPDGVTPIVGDLEVQLPLESWPFLASSSAGNVSVSYGSSATPVTASITVKDGEVKYLIPNVHFSKPIISIGSKLAEKSGRRVKVKNFLVTAGVAPPKGSIVKITSTSIKTCKVTSSQISYLKKGTCRLRIEIYRGKKSKVLLAKQVVSIEVRKR